jgi:hypothetical protein
MAMLGWSTLTPAIAKRSDNCDALKKTANFFLENDKNNTVEILKKRALDLDKLSDKELKARGEKGKEKKEEVEGAELKQIRKKHGI